MRLKKNLESLKNRADIMDERISDLEDRNIEMLPVDEERGLRCLKNEGILGEIYDSVIKAT